MNILNTLNRRSLKLNRKRTIVTIIGIILSAAMICATISIAVSFQDLFVQRAKLTDGNFHATFRDVSPEKSKYITGNAYTQTAMFSRNLGFALFDQSTNRYRPYFFIKEYDATALRHMPIKLTRGRYPEKAGEILLSEEALKSGGRGFHPGETISLVLGERLDPEGEKLDDDMPYDEAEQFATTAARTYTITGLIARPHFENFTSAPGFTAVAYLDPAALGRDEAVNISILGKNPRQIYDRVPEMATAAGEVEYSYNRELLMYSGVTRNEGAVVMLNTIAGIVILLITVGSVTVIYSAFAISVSERKKQFGLLAGTGATPGQIRRSVLSEGAFLGFIGIPLGILSGLGGIGVTLSIVNRLMTGLLFEQEVPLRLVVSPSLIPLTVLFVGLIILISAYLPAKRAAAASPIEAIRQSADIKIKGKTVKTSRLTRFLFGIEGELALKNLKRQRRRYRTTVFSLFISIVLFVSFSTLVDYVFTGSGLYYGEINFDTAVIAMDLLPGEQRELCGQIASLEGVERCTMVRERPMDTWLERNRFSSYFQKGFLDQDRLPADETGRYRYYFHLLAIGEDEFSSYAAENGFDAAIFEDSAHFKGILINKSMMQEAKRAEFAPLQLKAGDKLALEKPVYDGGGSKAALDVEISAVTDSYPMGVQPSDVGYSYLLLSESSFEAVDALLKEGEREEEKVEDARSTLQLYLTTAESAGVAEQLSMICGNYARGHVYINDIRATQQEMNRTKAVLSIFLYGFITLITLIGVTNIFNTISTNVALRRREFAMLKSVGLTPGGFNKMINYESIFYGLKALLYGLPVSALIALWMYHGFSNALHFTFFLPWKEILICIAGVFVIVFMTMLHAGSKLKRDNIIDALKEENL
ncbi:ABC transporter permease [Candidatus Darwinibacter acetoxidans]